LAKRKQKTMEEKGKLLLEKKKDKKQRGDGHKGRQEQGGEKKQGGSAALAERGEFHLLGKVSEKEKKPTTGSEKSDQKKKGEEERENWGGVCLSGGKARKDTLKRCVKGNWPVGRGFVVKRKKMVVYYGGGFRQRGHSPWGEAGNPVWESYVSDVKGGGPRGETYSMMVQGRGEGHFQGGGLEG